MLSLPRLHEISPGGHSVCKRGKGFRQNGRFRCRDCTKSALEGSLYANVARVFAQTDAFTAAIARNRPWRAVCMQTWQGISPKRMLSLPRLHKIGPGGRFVCKRGKGFNAARVFAETDAFDAAIARNRPWRAFCLQTWQGFSPKRTLSLPRLHKIGPGGWSVCKRGKGRKGYPPPACLRRRQHQQHSHRKQQRHRPHSQRHWHQQHSLHDGLTAQGCCHGSKRRDDDRKKRLKRRHGSKEWDDGSTQEQRRPPYLPPASPFVKVPFTIRASSHQAIKPSEHQAIRASNHQGIRASSHQAIRLSGHQGIRASEHQAIRPSIQSKKPGHSPGTSAEARAS